MKQAYTDKRRISFLLITEFLLVIFAMTMFGAAVVYGITRLKSDIQSIYIQPLAVKSAGLDAYTSMSRIHNRLTQLLLDNGNAPSEQGDAVLQSLDEKLNSSLSLLKSGIGVNTAEIDEIERLLAQWKNTHSRIIKLLRQGRRNQAFDIALKEGVPTYRQLEKNMMSVVNLSQHHIEKLINSANSKTSEIISFVWWLLLGFIITGIVSGIMVIRKISAVLEHGRQAEHKQHESEERMKLALSGADIGTWDLDPVSGKLDFDSQWGGLLNYVSDSERPHSLEQWSMLLFKEDKERVLKAMQDHIAGLSAEYKAEYRIFSNSGKLKWISGHGKAVSRDSNGKALRIVGISRDITQQKKAEDTIWKLAHTDALTGLPNRSLFYDRLAQCIAQTKRQNMKLALLFIDLDDFKQINDEYGHDTGDALLKEVAERLRHAIRNENTVARTGGDEFIIILTDIENAENAAIVARKIIGSVSSPMLIGQHHCQVGCSIGISIFPDNTTDMEKLISQADSAMYSAKSAGKNNLRFFAQG